MLSCMSEVTVLNEGLVEGEDGEMGREHGKWATVQEDMEVDMVVNMGVDCAESHGK